MAYKLTISLLLSLLLNPALQLNPFMVTGHNTLSANFH